MDDAKFLKKNIKTGIIDVHPTETALVVNYRVEAIVIGEEGDCVYKNKQDCQKVIKINSLDGECDLKALSSEVIRKCKLIPDGKQPEIEQLLYYLQNRKTNAHAAAKNLQINLPGGDSTNRSNSSNSSTSTGEKADLANLGDYIEILYEDVPTKVRGTSLILDLARNPDNLEELVQNELLLGVLTRVLREEWKKSIEFTTNIINIFMYFSDYCQFHAMISHFKIGALCMQIVEYELKRYDALVNPQNSSSAASSTGKKSRDEDFVVQRDEKPSSRLDDKKMLEIIIKKQNQLFNVAFRLLFNLSQENDTELKMINRDIVEILCQTWQQTMDKRAKLDESDEKQKNALSNVLISIGNFLKKLSVYKENIDRMIEERVVEKAMKTVTGWPRNENLVEIMARLLFNLSFDTKMRRKMSTANFISQMVPYIGNEKLQIYVLPLLYHISFEDQCKVLFTYTDCIPMCLKLCISIDEPQLENGESEDNENSISLKLPSFARRQTSPGSGTTTVSGSQIVGENNLTLVQSYVYKISCSLLINLASNKRSAELIAGDEAFAGLKTLIEKAFAVKSRLLARLLGQVSSHEGPLKFFFIEYVGDLANAVTKISFNRAERLSADLRRRYFFGVECLQLLANLTLPELNFGALLQEFDLLDWLFEGLKTSSNQSDRLILSIIKFIGTVCGDSGGAASLLERGIMKQLVQILSVKQENDDIVLHVLYVFYRGMFHESTRDFLMGDARVPNYLIELMHDNNPAIRKMCDCTLDLVAEHGHDWATRVQEERFRWHNAQWLEIVTGSSNFPCVTQTAIPGSNSFDKFESDNDESLAGRIEDFIRDDQFLEDDQFDTRSDDNNQAVDVRYTY